MTHDYAQHAALHAQVPEAPPAPRRSGRGWLGWFLFLITLAALIAAGYYLYWPLRTAKTGLERDMAGARAQHKRLQGELQRTRAELAGLSGEREKLKGELAHTVLEKEQIEAELKRVQGELSNKLDPEIQSGNVAIKRRGDRLVVDVSDQILFDKGQADVSERGKLVLSGVAPTLAQLKGHSVEVHGHTDSTRIVSTTTQEKFPTNWELSTARATNVVRFLQEHGKIPGSELAAVGYGEFKPTASNATDQGRRKNRRIEIVLVPHQRGG